MADNLVVSPEELDNFFAFLQCQLRKQTELRVGQEVPLKSQAAKDMWKRFDDWVVPNTKTDKWVPFHTALGAHELFALTDIHSTKFGWDDRQRLTALFIFRAHCRPSVFRDTQLPHMQTKEFWADPCKHFSEKGKIMKHMLDYRRSGNSMQTIAFRCIPKRLCDDADANLVINICNRTCTLIDIANRVIDKIQEYKRKKTSSTQLFNDISTTIRQGKGMGDTWVKMLMVSVDIAFPDLSLLSQHCEVGLGAVRGLQRIIPQFTSTDQSASKRALAKVTAAVNAAPKGDQNSAKGFWDLLPKVEELSRSYYKGYKLMLKQFNTPPKSMSAGTVQVQLCEWRQFHDWLTKKLKPNPQEDSTETDPKSEEEVEMDDDAPLVKLPVAGAAYALPSLATSSSSSSSSYSRSDSQMLMEGGRDDCGGIKRGSRSSLELAQNEPGAKRSRLEGAALPRASQLDRLVTLRNRSRQRMEEWTKISNDSKAKVSQLKLTICTKSSQCDQLRQQLFRADLEHKQALAEEQKVSFEGFRWESEFEVQNEALANMHDILDNVFESRNRSASASSSGSATASSFFECMGRLVELPEDPDAPPDSWVPETSEMQGFVKEIENKFHEEFQTELAAVGGRTTHAQRQIERIEEEQAQIQDLVSRLVERKNSLQKQYEALDAECRDMVESVRSEVILAEDANRECVMAKVALSAAEAALERFWGPDAATI